MIAFQSVTKVYHTKAGEVNALRGITAEFPDRGIVCIVGKSGCGKSTLLNLLGGLDAPTSGEILLNGEAAGGGELLRRVSYVFQDFGLFPFLTAEENVLVAGCSKENAAQLLEQVGLGEFAKRRARTLSGGEQQRLAIARALAKRPEIILADEPTGNLDGENAKTVFETFRKIAEERLVVVVTHDSESAEKYADLLISLRDGEIREIRSLREPSEAPAAETLPVAEPVLNRKESAKRSCKFAFALLRRAKARSGVFAVLFVLLVTVLCVLQSMLYANVFRLTCWHIEENHINYVKFECGIDGETGYVPMSIGYNVMTYLDENTHCIYTDIVDSANPHKPNGIGVCHGGLPQSVKIVEGSAEGGVIYPYGNSGYKHEGAPVVGDTYSLFETELPIVGVYDDEAFTDTEKSVLPSVLIREEDFPVRLGEKNISAQAFAVGIGKDYKAMLRYLLQEKNHCRLIDIGRVEGYGDIDMTQEIDMIGSQLESMHTIGYVAAAILGVLTVAYVIYFIGFSVSEHKREIGILRAFGIKYGEIKLIFVLQICFLILPAIVLSLGATGLVLWGLNTLYSPFVPFAYLRFNGFYALVCLGAFAACLLSVLAPLAKLKKLPLNPLIRNR